LLLDCCQAISVCGGAETDVVVAKVPPSNLLMNGILDNNRIVNAQPARYPPGLSIPPPLILWAAKISNKIDAPKGFRGKDTKSHSDRTAGSFGLMNDKAKTTKIITKIIRPTKVLEG
jgi:hypothetical protein